LRLPTSADLYEGLSCEAFMYTAHCHKLMANSLNFTVLWFGGKKAFLNLILSQEIKTMFSFISEYQLSIVL
jgi:hypothetical protein